MKLHIEQHQTAVSKWVNGAQGERCNQGGKERTPQGLQREVITHLMEKARHRKGKGGKKHNTNVMY